MIIAYHAIFSAYGFWLPNDPRGSWSDWIRKWELFRYGPATKTNARYSVAHWDHDRNQRLAAKRALAYPPVIFNGMQARAVANGFAKAAKDSCYTIHACAILPDHVHVVVARHQWKIERIVGHLKSAGTRRLNEDCIHPLRAYRDAKGDIPSPWARGRWKVFLNTPGDVRRSIDYVENNPLREGLRQQQWRFVEAYG